MIGNWWIYVDQSCFKACFEKVDDHLNLRCKLMDMTKSHVKQSNSRLRLEGRAEPGTAIKFPPTNKGTRRARYRCQLSGNLKKSATRTTCFSNVIVEPNQVCCNHSMMLICWVHTIDVSKQSSRSLVCRSDTDTVCLLQLRDMSQESQLHQSNPNCSRSWLLSSSNIASS